MDTYVKTLTYKGYTGRRLKDCISKTNTQNVLRELCVLKWRQSNFLQSLYLHYFTIQERMCVIPAIVAARTAILKCTGSSCNITSVPRLTHCPCAPPSTLPPPSRPSTTTSPSPRRGAAPAPAAPSSASPSCWQYWWCSLSPPSYYMLKVSALTSHIGAGI